MAIYTCFVFPSDKKTHWLFILALFVSSCRFLILAIRRQEDEGRGKREEENCECACDSDDIMPTKGGEGVDKKDKHHVLYVPCLCLFQFSLCLSILNAWAGSLFLPSFFAFLSKFFSFEITFKHCPL